MSTDKLTERVAQWVADTQYDDLPPSVIDAAESFIADTVGCIVGGTPVESSEIITRLGKSWGPSNGTSTIVGRQAQTSAPLAALINGTSSHALELEDTVPEAGGHCSVAVIPAALAVAEQEGSSGRDLILAVALGYEVMARVGQSLLGKAFWGPFHTTAILSPFGAVVSAGKLLGLNAEQMRSAIGMAASQSAGLSTYSTNGAWNKRFHAGNGAMAGVISASACREDFLGPSEAFLGDVGWYAGFAYQGNYDPAKLTDGLGENWLLLRNAVKRHACCRFSGIIVDAAIEVAEQEDLQPEDVADVVVAMASYPIERGLMEPRERKYNPVTVVDAQFSAPFAAAVGIVKRNGSLEEFSEEGIRDQTVLDITQKVRVEVDPVADRLWPNEFPCEVRVTRTDGSTVSARIQHYKGTPENPLTPAEFDAKFLSLTEPVMGGQAARRLLNELKALRTLDDVRQLSASLAGSDQVLA